MEVEKKKKSDKFWDQKVYSREEFHTFFKYLRMNFALIIIPCAWIAINYSLLEGFLIALICIVLSYVINKKGGLI